jgi:hypothetical protein
VAGRAAAVNRCDAMQARSAHRYHWLKRYKRRTSQMSQLLAVLHLRSEKNHLRIILKSFSVRKKQQFLRNNRDKKASIP